MNPVLPAISISSGMKYATQPLNIQRIIFDMIRLKSLKQKVVFFIILPLCLVLVIAGTIGMRRIEKVLLSQWEETAISKLERSAHQVDMRLMRPKEILRFFQQNQENQLRKKDLELLTYQLKNIDGVVQVLYSSPKFSKFSGRTRMGMQQPVSTTISSLKYDTETNSQTVSLVAQLATAEGIVHSAIEIKVAFYDLIDQIVKAPWWKGNKAFILDPNGAILASTELENAFATEQNFFQKIGDFHAKTWKAMAESTSGTVFSEETPPDMVSGYYKLKEAPWTLVVLTNGPKVLRPIINFRFAYFLICGFGIICVALYLWVITSRATNSINQISVAATRLSRGVFDPPLPVKSKDEISNLTHRFNVMSSQLKERLQLKQELSLAGEVQANLQPQVDYHNDELDIALLSKYCDDTGGDYVDILPCPQNTNRVTVVVADVVGHGVGAALLMTTLRALVRCRASAAGTPEEIISDVNTLLCNDTIRFGNFATLFYLTVDVSRKKLTWIRCGHEPAMVFSTKTKTFTELKGTGIPLGVDKEFHFAQNQYDYLENRNVILLGTDGIWEIENRAGETFGKERTKALISKYTDLSAREIADKILEEIEKFSDLQPPKDDITLAVIKTDGKDT